MKRILIIGATSAIAEAAARRWQERERELRLFLVGRTPTKLDAVVQDLQTRGATVAGFQLDANELPRHTEMLDAAWAFLQQVDIVLIAHGSLPEQRACEQSVELTLREFATNATSAIALLTLIANRMETQRSGTIAVITSVAGDRGRQSNYVYGAAKGALSIFLQGLRNRLLPSGVHVLTIKPGFIDTPMTQAFAKSALWATPQQISGALVRACERHSDIVYLPRLWALIMWIIRRVPEGLFKRLKL